MNKASTTVSEIMTPAPETVAPENTILEVKHIFEKQDFHHHIPVIQNDELVGMVSLIDFMRAIGQAGLDDSETIYRSRKVKDIMSIGPLSVEPGAAVEVAAGILSKGEVHALAVCENRRLVGIISTADLIRYYLGKN
jgi:CBS domain-containing protein